jgi:hypothetical protein
MFLEHLPVYSCMKRPGLLSILFYRLLYYNIRNRVVIYGMK